MGAIRVAMLVREEIGDNSHRTRFKGFSISQIEFKMSSFIREAYPNLCEICQISADGRVLARWGALWHMGEGRR
jgi:hypothetical protein